MSQKREKRRRREIRLRFESEWSTWRMNEPPRWRLIRHWRWKKAEPIQPKGAKRHNEINENGHSTPWYKRCSGGGESE